jgi:hypothetical protein
MADDDVKRAKAAAKAAMADGASLRGGSGSLGASVAEHERLRREAAAALERMRMEAARQAALTEAKAAAKPKRVERNQDVDEVWWQNQHRGNAYNSFVQPPGEHALPPPRLGAEQAPKGQLPGRQELKRYSRELLHRGMQGDGGPLSEQRPYSGGDKHYKSSWTGKPENDTQWRTRGMRDPKLADEEEEHDRGAMDI